MADKTEVKKKKAYTKPEVTSAKIYERLSLAGCAKTIGAGGACARAPQTS